VKRKVLAQRWVNGKSNEKHTVNKGKESSDEESEDSVSIVIVRLLH
jgi:hypothetical protein